jgi:hypothetical protein
MEGTLRTIVWGGNRWGTSDGVDVRRHHHSIDHHAPRGLAMLPSEGGRDPRRTTLDELLMLLPPRPPISPIFIPPLSPQPFNNDLHLSMSDIKPALAPVGHDTVGATTPSSNSSTSSIEYLPSSIPIPIPSPSRKRKASPTPTPKQPKKKTLRGPKGSSATTNPSGANGKTTGAWRREEVRALWDAMSLIPVREGVRQLMARH